MVFAKHAVLTQRLQGREAASAGDHGVAPDAVGARAFGAGNEVLEQSVGFDGGLQLGQRGGISGGLAYVLGRKLQLAQRDGPDDRPGISQHPTVESVQCLIMSSSFKARYVWVASRR